MRFLNASLVAALALGVLSPNDAAGQQTDPVAFWSATAAVGVPMLAVDAVLVVEALDKAISEGYGLYLPGAVFEIVWGAVHLAGAVVAAGLSTLAYDPVPLALTFAVPLGLVGGYFVAHGVWSLVPRGDRSLQVALAPLTGGAQAIVSGAF